MPPLEILAIAFGLAMDATAVSLAVGATIADLVAAVDHWIAFALLTFVGGRMVWSGLSPHPTRVPADPSRGLTLVAIGVRILVQHMAP